MSNPSIITGSVESILFFQPGETVKAHLSTGDGRHISFEIVRVQDHLEIVPFTLFGSPEAKPEDGAE